MEYLDGRTVSYTYDGAGNRRTMTETKTQYDSNGNGDGGTAVLSASYDLHNQMVSARTAETSVRNTYNAQGFRVAKEVTADGVTATSCFLYDEEHVIMEADGDGALTARNVYGGPLMFREVYKEAGAGDGDRSQEKVTYSYLYNAHGDVVALLSGGEAVATYSYDAFGNITGQTESMKLFL